MKIMKSYYLLVVVMLIGLVLATYVLYSKEEIALVNSFEECAQIYPVMESYPERCATPDGRSFTKVYPPADANKDSGNQSGKPNPKPLNPGTGTSTEPVFCTMDAMQCPDGSYVGRSGPNCEFVCPGN